MKLQVRVKDRAFKALDDASVVFALQQPDGTKSEVAAEPASGEAGLFEATVASEKAGTYRVKATVKDADGAVIGEPVAGWATNPVADETRSLHNRRALMERIATWSGGRVINLDDLSSLPDMLSKLVVPVTESRVEPLWQKWWWLAAVVVLLGIDWTLRRRAGEG